MNAILFILIIAIIAFTYVFLHLFIRLGDTEGRITLLEIKANYCEQSEKTLRESVDIQTKCIRDLNGIVKKSVESKEPAEPDTKALLGGWIVEEPEPPREQSRQIDSFRVRKFISSLYCGNRTPLYSGQQSILYPWQQSELNQVLGPCGIREWRINK